MFYLIGGAPRTGKTTLAKQLSKKLVLPWISTDTLESVVLKYVSDEELLSKFPKRVIRRETKQSNDVMYKNHSAQEIVDAYLKQAEGMEEAIQVFLESESRHGHSYILEGYHITPTLVTKLKGSGFETQSVFLGRGDVDDTRKSITINSGSSDWVIDKTENEETFGKIAEMIVLFSDTLKKGVQENYYSMDGDFTANLEKALNSFTIGL